VSAKQTYSVTHITGPPNGPVLFCSLASVIVCRLSFRQWFSTSLACGPLQSPSHTLPWPLTFDKKTKLQMKVDTKNVKMGWSGVISVIYQSVNDFLLAIHRNYVIKIR